jgi:hypothetical protein
MLMVLGGMLLLAMPLNALDTDIRGQFSGWTVQSKDRGDWLNITGARYLPQLTLSQMLTDTTFIDAELSLNGFLAHESEDLEFDRDLELYRLKLRLATPQTETRLGLQKINFGPAYLLRSLQWFDRLDPRDPQHLTDGVYALRFKYNTLTNASLWAWGLYGNDDPKGYERLPSVDDTPEFGGRVQYPLFDGELAATVHTRRVDASSLKASDFREYRIALDGRWEVTLGFWFESVLQYQDTDLIPSDWTRFTTLGADYTIGIGNGVHVLAEHFAAVSAEEPFGWDDDAQLSAISVEYPLGLFDTFTAIGSYAWETHEYSQYLSWQRSYDTWTLNISAFRYPDSDADLADAGRQAVGARYGGQIMVIYYH